MDRTQIAHDILIALLHAADQRPSRAPRDLAKRAVAYADALLDALREGCTAEQPPAPAAAGPGASSEEQQGAGEEDGVVDASMPGDRPALPSTPAGHFAEMAVHEPEDAPEEVPPADPEPKPAARAAFPEKAQPGAGGSIPEARWGRGDGKGAWHLWREGFSEAECQEETCDGDVAYSDPEPEETCLSCALIGAYQPALAADKKEAEAFHAETASAKKREPCIAPECTNAATWERVCDLHSVAKKSVRLEWLRDYEQQHGAPKKAKRYRRGKPSEKPVDAQRGAELAREVVAKVGA